MHTMMAKDLAVGQAAHWFDHDTVWKELQRVVRPKGTVAYWVCAVYSREPFMNTEGDVALGLWRHGLLVCRVMVKCH
jgi:hypothetical protein